MISRVEEESARDQVTYGDGDGSPSNKESGAKILLLMKTDSTTANQKLLNCTVKEILSKEK